MNVWPLVLTFRLVARIIRFSRVMRAVARA